MGAAGVMVTLLTTGPVFAMVIEAIPARPFVIPSFGVAYTVQVSPLLVKEDDIIVPVFPVELPFKYHS